jgi:antitoxin PrlF
MENKDIFISSVTQKGQTTIPLHIRKELGLKTGDKVSFEIHNGEVRLKKLAPFDADYHRAISATLSEWESPEDEEAFRDL